MAAVMPVALALLAQAASADAASATAPSPAAYGPTPPPAPKPVVPAKPADPDCDAANRNADTREIVICAQRSDGYRINRDILEARREKKQGDAGAPRSPHETFKPNDCASVGPMGCRGNPTINILSAAATAAEMARRLANGQEIGSMFQTTPTKSEYELYLEAKKRREAEEQAKAAKAVRDKAEAAAKAAAATKSAPQPAPSRQ